MRLEQVHYLLEIEKTHSASAAALNLYVSPSSISEAIKKLEQELGYTLFIRSKNGMELTRTMTDTGPDAIVSSIAPANDQHILALC